MCIDSFKDIDDAAADDDDDDDDDNLLSLRAKSKEELVCTQNFPVTSQQ